MSEPDDDDFPAVTLDAGTLRETFDDPGAAAAHVGELQTRIRAATMRADEIGELLTRGELVDLLRILGRFDEALDEANAAADRAQLQGTPPQLHTARLRLAHVHQWRGDFAESNLLLTELLAAAGEFGPVIEAFTHQYAGRNDYDQGHFADAREHFARALALRDELELDERDESRAALTATDRHLGGNA